MNIGFVPVQEIDSLWPVIAPDMQHACDRGGYPLTAGTLWQMCRSGGAFLCIVNEGSTLLSASVWRFEDDASLRCWCLAGRSMRSWLPQLRAFIETIGRSNGATMITAKGRGGWGRVFPKAERIGDDFIVRL